MRAINTDNQPPAYFDNIHPIYPFLDREDFEQALASGGAHVEKTRFLALYYAVLALGSQVSTLQPKNLAFW